MSTLIRIILFIVYFIIGLFMTAIFDAIFDIFEDSDGPFAFVMVIVFWPLILAALLVLVIVLPTYPLMQKVARKLTKSIKENLEKIEDECMNGKEKE